MDAATRSHIFEPFFTTKEKAQGTGLGLATVHGIVNQSGGHIWVYSEPDYGATFKIYLPRVESTTELPKPAGAGQARTPHGSETILLVEDEAPMREMAGRVLRGQGYQVLEANNGASALHISAHHQAAIHLLLTDLIMPGGFNGRQLAEQLTSQRPALKVLYMSGYTDNVVLYHGVMPDLAFLQKPFTPAVLARKVWEVLHQK
jgi:CheY-like chemotaxis protein